MKSFFKVLKYEKVNLWQYETYQYVITRLLHFLEDVYYLSIIIEGRRLYPVLGYWSSYKFAEILPNREKQRQPPPDSSNLSVQSTAGEILRCYSLKGI